MSTKKNPFTPNFGQIPCELAGRTEIISELLNAYDNAPGDPALTSILIGARGTGKTALLTYISERVQGQGWISVNVPCSEGMMEDIYQQTIKNAGHILEKRNDRIKSVSTGISIAGTGVQFGINKEASNLQQNWRIRMTEVLEELNEKEIGLLITIDEVNPSERDMINFASIYQMFIREERKVGILMAGLPSQVSALLRNKSVSFLRRASQFYLKTIPDYEIEHAFAKTVEFGGKTISGDALSSAVKAINGFPFMLQLVGYRTWAECEDGSEIDANAVRNGIRMAEYDLKSRVLMPTLDDITDVGLDFLRSMQKYGDYAYTKDIAKDMDKSSSYIATYKKRLAELGVIEDIARGKIKYALPHLREYLDEYDK